MALPENETAAFELSIAKLKNELELAKEENNALKSELMSQKIQAHEFECALKENTKLLNKLKNKNAMKEEFYTNMEKQATKTEIEHKALKHNFKITNITNEKLKSMIQTIETEKSELKTEITSLKSQLAKYQQFKQELIEGNNSLEESISSIKNSLNDLKHDKETLSQLNSEIPEPETLNSENVVLRTLLEKSYEEKNLLQEESCYYKALSHQLQTYLNDNASNQNEKYFYEKWKNNYERSKEIIEELITQNKLLEEAARANN
ncbi:testis-specific gene 10 protein-like isoform X1 [Atheta coriaria]|uniref:testis-specific gene 10 protein-like isoform X1 n=1 Tax=Dalotia coriaria TaxID=877792 RepID=UPI0031F43FBD